MLQREQSTTLAHDQTLERHLPLLRVKDASTFAVLSEPYRRELEVHCYRMMGSLEDAEDLVQETFLRAWQHLATFDQPVSFRAWLYKIATNVCLDALAKRPRRQLPSLVRAASDVREEYTPPVSEMVSAWLEPYPDELLAGVDANPEARYATRENITLAFLAALQILSPRQRAVLILLDVLDWRAAEAAQLLDVSVAAVNSTLHRARATMSSTYHSQALDVLRASPEDDATRELLNRYMRAWEEADIESLVTLLKKDAIVSMPPSPVWYQGRAPIRTFMSKTFFTGDVRGRWKFLPTHANAQPAAGLYMRDEARKAYLPFTIHVISADHGRVGNILSFIHPTLFPRFGLPETMPLG
jgi:RNA polymerase sigma-70 factor (ECF subfamily)